MQLNRIRIAAYCDLDAVVFSICQSRVGSGEAGCCGIAHAFDLLLG